MNQETRPMPEPTTKPPAGAVLAIPLTALTSNPDQPRRCFDDDRDLEGHTSLDRLAESIKRDGVLQPLVITQRDGKYLIVCGERRFRAARMAGLTEVPCMIRPALTDMQVLELALVENLQRENLSPIDEARAIDALMKRCRYSQAAVGKVLGVSAAAVNYKLGLLGLSPELQKEIDRGQLTQTQGRVIAQTVNRVPASERPKVMEEIRKGIDHAKAAGSPPFNTKDVAKLTRSIAQIRPAPVPSDPPPPPDGQRVVPTPPTRQERERARRFLRFVSTTASAARPFILRGPEAVRFAWVLRELDGKVQERAKDLQGFFFVLVEALEDAAHQRGFHEEAHGPEAVTPKKPRK